MIKLSPSILAADFSNLSNVVNQCKQAKVSMIRVHDVMEISKVITMTENIY